MKRRIILLVIAFAYSIGIQAKSNDASVDLGYKGNISVSLSPDCIFKSNLAGTILTSHGYNFENGLWLGGGLGVFLPIDEVPSLPFFSEIQYSFLSSETVRPYVSCKIGFCLHEFAEDIYSYISPTIGLTIKNCSIFMSYNDMRLLKFASIGFAWNFW